MAAALNETQNTILAMVVEGKTNAQIAEKLHYSIRNIKYHLEKYTRFTEYLTKCRKTAGHY